jgi:shikimate dehydrogenase
MINAETVLCGVIGNPVRHTLSPAIHNAAISHLKLDYAYLAFEVKRAELGNAISGMRALGIRGLNVTIPHKINALQFLDELDPMAMNIGAVNTIVNSNGRLKGYNTDAGGFLQSLLAAGFDPQNKNVVLLGAGGAARAVGFALAGRDACITILNRESEIEQAQLLAQHLSRAATSEIEAMALDESTLAKALENADLVVNATSLGMTPNIENTPVPAHLLKKELVVYDVVYAPLETRLLREAAACGCRTISGLEMLVRQGALALELWTGQPAPVDVMRGAALAALGAGNTPKPKAGGKTSVALIGFMGAGKSSVGRVLSKKLNKTFVDIDRRIIKKAGKSIERIFSENGEPAFRDIERETTAEAARRGEQVIACGGGVVLSGANITALRKKAVVIYLDASREPIVSRVTNSKVERPLLANGNPGETIEKLMRIRKPLYEQAADIILDTSELDVEATADRIIERLDKYEGFRF